MQTHAWTNLRTLSTPSSSLKRVIDGFGVRRSFWGSDFSRLPARCSYREAVTMFTEELDFLSAGELEWVMGRGVLSCLGWQPEGRRNVGS